MQKQNRRFSWMTYLMPGLLALLVLLAPLLALSQIGGWSSPVNAQAVAAAWTDTPIRGQAVPAVAATVMAVPSSAMPAGDTTRDARLLVLAGDGNESALH